MGLAKYYEDNLEIMEERSFLSDRTMQTISVLSCSDTIKEPKTTINKKHTTKVIECCDCGKGFLFTGGEQQFYEKHHLCLPKRCPCCRNSRKALFREINKNKEKQK